jgi:hypothetical protein
MSARKNRFFFFLFFMSACLQASNGKQRAGNSPESRRAARCRDGENFCRLASISMTRLPGVPSWRRLTHPPPVVVFIPFCVIVSPFKGLIPEE